MTTDRAAYLAFYTFIVAVAFTSGIVAVVAAVLRH